MNTEFEATIKSIGIKGPSDTLPATTITPTFVVTPEDENELMGIFGGTLAACIYGRRRQGGVDLAHSIKPNIPLEAHVMRIEGINVRCYPVFHQVTIKDGDVAVHVKITYLQDRYDDLTCHLISKMGQVVTVALKPVQQELPGVVLDAEAAEVMESRGCTTELNTRLRQVGKTLEGLAGKDEPKAMKAGPSLAETVKTLEKLANCGKKIGTPVSKRYVLKDRV